MQPTDTSPKTKPRPRRGRTFFQRKTGGPRYLLERGKAKSGDDMESDVVATRSKALGLDFLTIRRPKSLRIRFLSPGIRKEARLRKLARAGSKTVKGGQNSDFGDFRLLKTLDLRPKKISIFWKCGEEFHSWADFWRRFYPSTEATRRRKRREKCVISQPCI